VLSSDRPGAIRERIPGTIHAVLLGAVIFLAAGCSTTSAIYTEADAGKTVPARVGSELDIELGSIGPSSYGDPSLSSNSVEYLDVSVVGPYNPGGATQRYRFRITGAGETTITIPVVDEPTEVTPPLPFTLTVNAD